MSSDSDSQRPPVVPTPRDAEQTRLVAQARSGIDTARLQLAVLEQSLEHYDNADHR
jgi:hypothetical protein